MRSPSVQLAPPSVERASVGAAAAPCREREIDGHRVGRRDLDAGHEIARRAGVERPVERRAAVNRRQHRVDGATSPVRSPAARTRVPSFGSTNRSSHELRRRARRPPSARRRRRRRRRPACCSPPRTAGAPAPGPSDRGARSWSPAARRTRARCARRPRSTPARSWWRGRSRRAGRRAAARSGRWETPRRRAPRERRQDHRRHQRQRPRARARLTFVSWRLYRRGGRLSPRAPRGSSTTTSPRPDARLAGETKLVDEVDVAEVLALGGVERREVLLAAHDLHPAEAAGRLADAGGGDLDARAPRDLEHRFARGAFDARCRRAGRSPTASSALLAPLWRRRPRRGVRPVRQAHPVPLRVGDVEGVGGPVHDGDARGAEARLPIARAAARAMASATIR